MELELKNKSVLVTGSHRGTGQVIAESFASEGANVFFHSLTEPIEDLSANGKTVWGDITTESGADQVFQQVSTNSNHLDILVNNYGKAATGKWGSTKVEEWMGVYETNTLSSVRMIQHFSDTMKSGARIINLGTIGSTRPNNVMPHYYSAKGALAILTVSLAKELGPRGINVNLVSPGLIRTPEIEAHYLKRALEYGWGDNFEDAEEKIAKEFFPNPLKRIATREEIADVILFLASARASFVNGQNIRVDGGAVDIV